MLEFADSIVKWMLQAAWSNVQKLTKSSLFLSCSDSQAILFNIVSVFIRASVIPITLPLLRVLFTQSPSLHQHYSTSSVLRHNLLVHLACTLVCSILLRGALLLNLSFLTASASVFHQSLDSLERAIRISHVHFISFPCMPCSQTPKRSSSPPLSNLLILSSE